jgi:hypothetical protein
MFPAILGLAMRPRCQRTEVFPGLDSRCGPSAVSTCASQTASVRSTEHPTARRSEQGRHVRERYAAKKSPSETFAMSNPRPALSCVQRKVRISHAGSIPKIDYRSPDPHRVGPMPRHDLGCGWSRRPTSPCILPCIALCRAKSMGA